MGWSPDFLKSKKKEIFLDILFSFAFIGQIISLFLTRAHVNWDSSQLFLSEILNMDTFWFPKEFDSTFYVQFLGNLRDFMLANILCLSLGTLILAILAVSKKEKITVLLATLYLLLFVIIAIPWLLGLVGNHFCKLLYISVSFLLGANIWGGILYFVEGIIIFVLFGSKLYRGTDKD